MKEEIKTVLDKHNICVISTVGPDSMPESAMVGFSSSNNLELLIGTSQKSRKYANIIQNPNVAITVGDLESEVQYEGTAQLLETDEAQDLLGEHFAQLPGTDKYLNDPDQRWLLVTPTWARLTVHGEQDRIEELRDFA